MMPYMDSTISPQSDGEAVQRVPLKVFYVTGSERNADVYFRALANRYGFVCVAYEHGSKFSIRIGEKGSCKKTVWSIPRIPRYFQLLYQWGRLCAFICSRKFTRRWDVCISESIQFSLLAPFLKKAGFLGKLVHYSQDWFPKSPIIQRYDRYCCRHADMVWNLTDKISHGRIQRWGKANEAFASRTIGPLCIPNKTMCRVDNTLEKRCCYMGGLRHDVGLELAIQAVSILRDRGINIGLNIAGKEIYHGVRAKMQKLAEEKRVEDLVAFHGFLDHDTMLRVLSKACCCLAIFTGGETNYSNWTEPFKVREYMELGKAIVISRTNIMAPELITRRAGYAVDDSPESVAEALDFFCSNLTVAEEYGRNAYQLALEKSDPTKFYQAIEELAFGGLK